MTTATEVFPSVNDHSTTGQIIDQALARPDTGRCAHDHVEDKTPAEVRESAYRRGYHQALEEVARAREEGRLDANDFRDWLRSVRRWRARESPYRRARSTVERPPMPPVRKPEPANAVASKKQVKFLNHRRPLSVGLAAPAVRMVVIHAWHYVDESGNKGGHDVYPVVAIRSEVVDTYYYRYNPATGEEPYPGSCHDELVKDGWSHDGRSVVETVLIHDRCYGLVALDDFDCANTASRLFVCAWPPADDEARLADVVAQVKAEAARKATAG